MWRTWLSLGIAGVSSVSSVASAQAPIEPQEAGPKLATAPDTSPESTEISKEQCVIAHRQVQQAQREGKLLQAREFARVCTDAACPALLVEDCMGWLNGLNQHTPSVIFEVRVDGQPNDTAIITADNELVSQWARGESLMMDPGEHQFRVELAPYEPLVMKVLLTEGMRFRLIHAEFRSKVASTSPAGLAPLAPSPTSSNGETRPTPFVVYPLLGVGALGIAGFAAFASIGWAKESSLDRSCRPNCTDGDLKALRTSYLVGDISLGVGAAALITAGAYYLARPQKPILTSLGVAPIPGGLSTAAIYHF